MTDAKPKTVFRQLLETHFPGKRFVLDVKKRAARALKITGEESAIAILLSAKDGDIRPPAKCFVVASSRPIKEFPIAKCSGNIQRYMYSLPHDQLVLPGTSKAEHDAWFTATGADDGGYRNVQGLNLIFKNAYNTYLGVIKKVENRNAKKKKKHEQRLARGWESTPPQEELALGEDGKLLHPPGINSVIMAYQAVGIKPYSPSNRKGSKLPLPKEYDEYQQPAIIPIGKMDRLEIQKGDPGYIPEWQRPNLKKFGRIRNRANKPTDALLVRMSFGDDWIVIDVRGLLRNALYRKIDLKEKSIQDLLNLYSGDAIINHSGEVTFLYLQGVASQHVSTKPIKTYKSKEKLQELTKDGGSVALVSIDLGEINPISCRISRLDSKLTPQHLGSFFLPDDLLREIKRYRQDYDKLQADFEQKAVLALPEEMQVEYRNHIQNDTAETTKAAMCKALSIDAATIDWSKINDQSSILSKAVIELTGNYSLVTFSPDSKRTGIKRDITIAYEYKSKLSEETRKALNDKKFDTQRASVDFDRFSKRKDEFTNRCVNYICKQAKHITGEETVVINVEDLEIKEFNGRGKRETGWTNLFTPKKENRWFISAFYKSFVNLAANKGMTVIQSRPHYTSMTCPDCKNCDKNNRSGEVFVCTKCGAKYNTDLHVATINLETVAITGKGMPGPEREQSGAVKTPRVARKRKDTKTQESFVTVPDDKALCG